MWVLNCGGTFPCGIFESREMAEEAISRYGLSGILTWYPPNTLAYDWSLEKGYFTPKRPEQSSAAFIGGFTSASQEHYHYADGKLQG